MACNEHVGVSEHVVCWDRKVFVGKAFIIAELWVRVQRLLRPVKRNNRSEYPKALRFLSETVVFIIATATTVASEYFKK